MSYQNLHNSLLRPPIIQILRAAGFHGTRPAVLDTLADITARYLTLLASSTASHAFNNHQDHVPNVADVRMALQDAGALKPQLNAMEEQWLGEEDMRGLEGFLGWFKGPTNREIGRIAGKFTNEGEVADVEALGENEDYLMALKTKHSKTGEESRYQGTVLGKDAEEHDIIIEGGPVESIHSWGMQVKDQEKVLSSPSSAMSSAPESASGDEDVLGNQ